MRVKEQMQKEREVAFEKELSFREWLEHYMSEPTDEELNDMEKEVKEKNTLLSLQSLNNTHYNTPQGA